MTHDDLERILSTDRTLETSPGFTRNVMAAVHRAADEPPSRRFPWRRFWTGVAACNATAGAATLLLTTPGAPFASIAPELSFAATVLLFGLGVAAIPQVLRRS